MAHCVLQAASGLQVKCANFSKWTDMVVTIVTGHFDEPWPGQDADYPP